MHADWDRFPDATVLTGRWTSPPKLEIERKFLLRGDTWRKSAIDRQTLRDGLIVSTTDSKVRVRVSGTHATLAVKGPRTGCSRVEYEYPIPLEDAEHLLRTCCSDRIVEKTRYRVPHGGNMWEIDVYGGALAGLAFAEIELESENQPFERPDWLGSEVTADPRFSKHALMERYLEEGRLRRCDGRDALGAKWWDYCLLTGVLGLQ